jgi:hypothetical protein
MKARSHFFALSSKLFSAGLLMFITPKLVKHTPKGDKLSA